MGGRSMPSSKASPPPPPRLLFSPATTVCLPSLSHSPRPPVPFPPSSYSLLHHSLPVCPNPSPNSSISPPPLLQSLLAAAAPSSSHPRTPLPWRGPASSSPLGLPPPPPRRFLRPNHLLRCQPLRSTTASSVSNTPPLSRCCTPPPRVLAPKTLSFCRELHHPPRTLHSQRQASNPPQHTHTRRHRRLALPWGMLPMDLPPLFPEHVQKWTQSCHFWRLAVGEGWGRSRGCRCLSSRGDGRRRILRPRQRDGRSRGSLPSTSNPEPQNPKP